jgi:hypothetical protein
MFLLFHNKIFLTFLLELVKMKLDDLMMLIVDLIMMKIVTIRISLFFVYKFLITLLFTKKLNFHRLNIELIYGLVCYERFETQCKNVTIIKKILFCHSKICQNEIRLFNDFYI